MKRLLSATALLLLTTSCSGLKVHMDHDSRADFTKFTTYAWKWKEAPPLEGSDPLLHRKLLAAADEQLAGKGLRLVTSKPDVYITYYTDTAKEVVADTTGFGYSHSPYWRGGGMHTTSTRVTEYTIGTLVIDIWDAEASQLVWRGTASDTVSGKPGGDQKKIDNALAKMFALYPPPTP